MSRTGFLVVAGVLLLAAIGSGAAVYLTRDDPARGLTITWGGSEGHPCCTFDPAGRTVEATIAIQGTAPRRENVTVTVTAYADENTSQLVGSATRTVQVDGKEHTDLVVTIPVSDTPHIDEDGVAACRLAVKYGSVTS